MNTTATVDKTRLIELLNEDLSLEYRSVLQYVHQLATIKGAKYQQTLNELGDHLNQELEHALILSKQIDFLGGEPTTEVAPVHRSKDAQRALEDDLALESTQLRRYRKRVDQAAELGLPDVAEALAPVLHQTQDHMRDLQKALGR
ncbi:MAG: ferritin-like domain-containing protein [Pseudomonadales bacterium]